MLRSLGQVDNAYQWSFSCSSLKLDQDDLNNLERFLRKKTCLNQITPFDSSRFEQSFQSCVFTCKDV